MMKTSLVLLVLFWGALSTGQAHASQNKFSWADYNRFVEIAVGLTQQNYAEFDTSGLTTDGILNTEKGNNKNTQLSLRWQTNNGVWVQAQAQRQNGATNYQGYLQGNGSLVPHKARTGNIANQYLFQIGYAFNSKQNEWAKLDERLQIIPMLQIEKNHWQRDLEQYRERYHYTTHAISITTQWAVATNFLLEMQAIKGRANAATVNVSFFNFKQQQTQGKFNEFQLGMSYQLPELGKHTILTNWRINARYVLRKVNHGASLENHGLQAPPNQNKPSKFMLGLQKQF